MSTETTTEIMMQFIDKNGNPVPAECTTFISPNDRLASQPVPDFAGGFVPGCYFLVDTFKFGMQLNDGETKGGNQDPNSVVISKLHESTNPELRKAARNAAKAAKNASFARWRSADKWKQQGGGTPPYNAHIDDFSFTRRIDMASTTLFSYCSSQDSFQFASLIKRKSAAVPFDPFPENQAYLRIDFSDVQISSFQWSDDDVVEETCAFRAKKMLIQFWTEAVDVLTGTQNVLGPSKSVKWENTVTNTPQGQG